MWPSLLCTLCTVFGVRMLCVIILHLYHCHSCIVVMKPCPYYPIRYTQVHTRNSSCILISHKQSITITVHDLIIFPSLIAKGGSTRERYAVYRYQSHTHSWTMCELDDYVMTEATHAPVTPLSYMGRLNECEPGLDASDELRFMWPFIEISTWDDLACQWCQVCTLSHLHV